MRGSEVTGGVSLKGTVGSGLFLSFLLPGNEVNSVVPAHTPIVTRCSLQNWVKIMFSLYKLVSQVFCYSDKNLPSTSATHTFPTIRSTDSPDWPPTPFSWCLLQTVVWVRSGLPPGWLLFCCLLTTEEDNCLCPIITPLITPWRLVSSVFSQRAFCYGAASQHAHLS